MSAERIFSLSTCSLLYLGLVAALAGPAHAQEPFPLTLTKVIPVAGFSNTITMIPIRCDSDGNIYVRGYRMHNTATVPVVKISADGEKTTVFSLDKVTDPDSLHNGAITDFTVSPRGQLYMLARQANDSYVVQFDSDGEFESTTKLQSSFFPLKIAVFPSDDFLISGSLIKDTNDAPSGTAETAIFDRTGKFVKNLTLQGDVKLGIASNLPKGSEIAEQEKTAPGAQIALGTAIVGDDGNVYMYRLSSQLVVYVISGDGQVLRRLTLKPPGSGYVPDTIKEAGGTLVVDFDLGNPKEGTSNQYIYSLFNAETGEKVADYKPSKEIRGNFACYTPNGFTFLTVAGGKGELIQAALR